MLPWGAVHGVLLNVTPKVKQLKAMPQYADYTVTVCGHSLGAGTASLVTYLIYALADSQDEDSLFYNIKGVEFEPKKSNRCLFL